MSSRIYVVDTSVFCNLLDIPGRNQRRGEAKAQFDLYSSEGGEFYLPLATILETGNHIAHLDNGDSRRKFALRFVNVVKDSLNGKNPFHPLYFWKNEEMALWIESFAEYAAGACGFGDLTVIKDFERLCEMKPAIPSAQPIEIWSYDDHLQGYARP